MNRAERRRQKREEQNKRENKIMSQQNFNDIWSETLPLTDELIEKLIESGEMTQEELDKAKKFFGDELESGEIQLEWNPKRKSIMSSPQMFGDNPSVETECFSKLWRYR